MADSYLTVHEIAELLKVHAQTIRNWIDRGELPAVRVGQRRVRVRQSDLDAFIERGATGNRGQHVAHPLPTGPDDSTPGCRVELTKAQLERVQELDSAHTVELERRDPADVRGRA